MKLETFDKVSSNICSLVTSVLTTTIVASPHTPLSTSTWSWACTAESCSYCYLMMAYKSYWPISYSSGSNIGVKYNGNDESGRSVGSWDVKTSKVEEAVLLLLLLLYFNDDISVCDNRPSSYSVYMFY